MSLLLLILKLTRAPMHKPHHVQVKAGPSHPAYISTIFSPSVRMNSSRQKMKQLDIRCMAQ